VQPEVDVLHGSHELPDIFSVSATADRKAKTQTHAGCRVVTGPVPRKTVDYFCKFSSINVQVRYWRATTMATQADEQLTSNQVIAIVAVASFALTYYFSSKSDKTATKALEVAIRSEAKQDQQHAQLRQTVLEFDAAPAFVTLTVGSGPPIQRCPVPGSGENELPLLMNCGPATARQVVLSWKLDDDKGSETKVSASTKRYNSKPFHIRGGHDARLQPDQLPDFLLQIGSYRPMVFRGEVVIDWKDLDSKNQRARQRFVIKWEPCERCGNCGRATIQFSESVEEATRFS